MYSSNQPNWKEIINPDPRFPVCEFVNYCLHFIFTARIRRMREGNIFSLSTLAGGGTPSQVWVGGLPHLMSQ